MRAPCFLEAGNLEGLGECPQFSDSGTMLSTWHSSSCTLRVCSTAAVYLQKL